MLERNGTLPKATRTWFDAPGLQITFGGIYFLSNIK